MKNLDFGEKNEHIIIESKTIWCFLTLIIIGFSNKTFIFLKNGWL